MTTRTDTARRLSQLAQRVYRDWCGDPAYVYARRGGYELHEPDPNAFLLWYATARECEAALRGIEADREGDNGAHAIADVTWEE